MTEPRQETSRECGARFGRCDLQVHSPLEPEFKPGVSNDAKAIANGAVKWVKAATDAGLEVVALTDHNAVDFIEAAEAVLAKAFRGDLANPTEEKTSELGSL